VCTFGVNNRFEKYRWAHCVETRASGKQDRVPGIWITASLWMDFNESEGRLAAGAVVAANWSNRSMLGSRVHR